jgi:acetolactate synthase-1/2/3 large subunit
MHEHGPQVIHLAYSPAQIDDVYYPQHEVVGCTAANLRLLAALIQPSPGWDLGYFGRVREDIERHVYAHCDADDFPPLPQRIVSDVRRAMPSDGILSLDNGLYKIWFARNYRAHEPNSILLDNALATMGAGLPTAIAAKLVCPGRRVMAVCGDGGFMMNSQELETAMRLGLDLTVVILRDNAYGMIKWKQVRTGKPAFGVDFGNPDFVQYAQSYGARGLRIGATAELLPALRDCLAAGGVHVVEVPIDYLTNRPYLRESDF